MRKQKLYEPGDMLVALVIAACWPYFVVLRLRDLWREWMYYRSLKGK